MPENCERNNFWPIPATRHVVWIIKPASSQNGRTVRYVSCNILCTLPAHTCAPYFVPHPLCRWRQQSGDAPTNSPPKSCWWTSGWDGAGLMGGAIIYSVCSNRVAVCICVRMSSGFLTHRSMFDDAVVGHRENGHHIPHTRSTAIITHHDPCAQRENPHISCAHSFNTTHSTSDGNSMFDMTQIRQRARRRHSTRSNNPPLPAPSVG